MNTIVLSADYKYRDNIETTIKSILSHTDNVNIYIINSDIPHEWFVNVNQYTNQIGTNVIDEKIDPGLLSDLDYPDDRISNIVYGKFLIPKLIDADRVLYLDSDVVVENNLNKLFELDLEGKGLAASRDFRHPDTFNSGVMLINNKKWREDQVSDKLLDMSKDKNRPHDDQSIIKDFFKDQIMELDPAYNYQVGYAYIGYWTERGPIEGYLEDVVNPKIIHYITDDKPSNLVSIYSMRDKWWHYNNLEWSEIVKMHTQFNPRKIGKQHFDVEAFTFTQYAEVQNLEDLIKRLPNVHFNVAAYTPVAWKLMGLTKYDNFSLYPSIISPRLKKLAENCDVYLDINWGGNEENVFKEITYLKKPILAFESTKSNIDYDDYHVFKDNEIDKMAATIESYAVENNVSSFDNIFNIKVKNANQSLDLILKHKMSVIRLGDGEFDCIRNKSIRYQEANEELAKRLKEILLKGTHDNTLVCVPDVFRKLDRYTQGRQSLYLWNFFPENHDLLKEMEERNNLYGSTFLSRPYIMLKDKSKSTKTFDKLKEIWQDRDLLIVEGSLTRSGEGNDLFAGAKSIKRIICPNENAYAKIDQIEDAIRKNAENRLVLLMLGPTAKVIVDDLQDMDNQMIDLGHLDSEYEWYKMGTLYPVPLENKHSAEFALGVTLEKDPEFDKEVVAKVE